MMLEGIRVLDLSRVIAGPYCATLMADLGADVVKVERPGRGDDLRAWRGNGMSATFAAINRNKRGIAVDLQQPEGSTLVFELARRADVVVENFLPGVADRLGLGYTAVRAVNPAAVYVSVTGFGQTGGHARAPADESRRLRRRRRRGVPRLRRRERRARPSTPHGAGPAPRREPAGLHARAAARSRRPLFRLGQAAAPRGQPEPVSHPRRGVPHQGRLGPGRRHEPRPV